MVVIPPPLDPGSVVLFPPFRVHPVFDPCLQFMSGNVVPHQVFAAPVGSDMNSLFGQRGEPLDKFVETQFGDLISPVLLVRLLDCGRSSAT